MSGRKRSRRGDKEVEAGGKAKEGNEDLGEGGRSGGDAGSG